MELKLETLVEAERYIEKLQEATEKMIQQIQLGKVESTFGTLHYFSDGLEWLLEVFKLTEDIQVQKISTDEINETITTLIEAMENKDWMLLQDCLEYSLLDQLIAWKNDIHFILDYYKVNTNFKEEIE